MVRVIWAPGAVEDFHGCVQFLKQRAPQFAKKWAVRVVHLTRALGDHPYLGRPPPEVGKADARVLSVEGYKVFYRVRAN